MISECISTDEADVTRHTREPLALADSVMAAQILHPSTNSGMFPVFTHLSFITVVLYRAPLLSYVIHSPTLLPRSKFPERIFVPSFLNHSQ